MINLVNSRLKSSVNLSAALILCVALSLMGATHTFALNRDGVHHGAPAHKSLNFTGYQYVDSTHVAICIDKCINVPSPYWPDPIVGSIDKSMFTIKRHDNHLPVTVSNLTYEQDYLGQPCIGSGCTDTKLTTGTRIILTLVSPLTADTAYDLTIQNTLSSVSQLPTYILLTCILDNSESIIGQTLNNFNNTGDPNQYDLTFTFRTPKPDGTYSSTVAPYVTYIVGGMPVSPQSDDRTGVSYESNLTIVFDRPMLASTRNTFLESLSNNYKRNGVKVIQATGDITTNQAPEAECHYPTSNNKDNINTTFYFPQTNNPYWYSKNDIVSWYNSGYSFNRKNPGSYSYTVTLPSYTDVSGHTWTTFTNARTNLATTGFNFATVIDDLPGCALVPNVAPTSTPGQLLVSWDPNMIDPVATGVKIYATSGNKWTSNYQLKGYTSSFTVGSITITGLTSGTPCWVRLAPYNSIGVIGFSQEVCGTPR